MLLLFKQVVVKRKKTKKSTKNKKQSGGDVPDCDFRDYSQCYSHGEEFCDDVGGDVEYVEGDCKPCKKLISGENVIVKGKCLARQ